MRLEAGWDAKRNNRPRKRGPSAQTPVRNAEKQVRQATMQLAEALQPYGVKPPALAAALGLSVSTLREWERKEAEGETPGIRGRPAERSSRDDRNYAIAVLHLLGPTTGVPVMQTLFPKMARREVEDLVRRYKRLYRKHRRLKLHVLRWLRPGSVWAVDLAAPPSPVDGVYPFVLAVRDLATGQQLAWVPMPDKRAETIVSHLEALVLEYGAPLVLKSDNEATLKGHEMAAFLERAGIVPLLSPRGVPSYNGSIEAGIGSMKTRTHIEAARNDRVGAWSCDDLEAARLQANTTARPQGPGGPTPEEAWLARTAIREETRVQFGRTLQRCRQAVLEEEGAVAEDVVDEKTASRRERDAMTRALVARGLLQVRRREVSLPLKRLFSPKIS